MVNNILIVEDDIKQRTNLKKILNELDNSLNIYEAESEEEALEISNTVDINVFYVDISLKDSSGIDFAKNLRKINKYEFTWIVFLTTHVQYMIEAFKQIHCYDYIIKPYEKEDIIELTKKLVLGIQNNTTAKIERKFVIFDLKNGVSIKLYVDEILFIEVNMRTCYIHTKDGKYEAIGLSVKKILDLTNCYYIVQSFRSFIVNTNHIIGGKIEKLFFRNARKFTWICFNYYRIFNFYLYIFSFN